MTLRFNDGGFTIMEKLFKALREILQHWRLSLASLLFYILLSLLTNVSRENFLVLATNITTNTKQYHRHPRSPASTLRTLVEPQCTEESQRCYTLRNETDVEEICNLSIECRTRSSLDFCLENCQWRTRMNLVQIGNNNSDCLSMNTQECTTCLQDLLDRDRDVKQNYENYSSILRRYDCRRHYSMWGCEDCKDVYKKWLCGLSFDFYDEERIIKPCLGFCYVTSRRCPYLLPSTPYCGTQSYFCPQYRDLFKNSTYAHEEPCFQCANNYTTPCELELTNQTDPIGAASSTTKASVTSLLIGQLVLLWIWRTLFDLSPGFA